jgi:hypothetical protein
MCAIQERENADSVQAIPALPTCQEKAGICDIPSVKTRIIDKQRAGSTPIASLRSPILIRALQEIR